MRVLRWQRSSPLVGAVALITLAAGCSGDGSLRDYWDDTPHVDAWSAEFRDGILVTPSPDRTPMPWVAPVGVDLPLGARCGVDQECLSERCVFGQCYPQDITPETGMSLIPGGWAVIGSTASENGRRSGSEFARSHVLLPGPFLMDRTPITEAQWRALMNNQRASQNIACGLDCPVERVTWWSALEFANRRSISAGFTPCYDLSELDCTGNPERGQMVCELSVPPFTTYDDAFLVEGCDGYRLPAEFEWEHAFRAGSETAFPGGDLVGNPRACEEQPPANNAGWHCGNSDGSKQPVALWDPNGYLLYDMAGNVREWMADVYMDADLHFDFMGIAEYVGRTLWVMGIPNITYYHEGAPAEIRRTMRGGSWRERPEWGRASARTGALADQRHQLFGFRLVRSVETSDFAVRTERCRVGLDACTEFRHCSPCVDCEASDEGDGVCIDRGMVHIPRTPGFLMGSPEGETGRRADETQREVTLTKSFTASTTEVTVAEWRRVMGADPSQDRDCGPECPVNRVSWWSALAFANALSEEAGIPSCYSFAALTCTGDAARGTLDCGTAFPLFMDAPTHPVSGNTWWLTRTECVGFRLPTEAEWEYMARATSDGPYGDPTLASVPAPTCEDVNPALDAFAAYCANVASWQPVAQRDANAFGLFDMHGNVAEWVYDGYAADLSAYPSEDPRVQTGTTRVHRGGHFGSNARRLRAAERSPREPHLGHQRIGLRIVRDVFCAFTDDRSGDTYAEVGVFCFEQDDDTPPVTACDEVLICNDNTYGCINDCNDADVFDGDCINACLGGVSTCYPDEFESPLDTASCGEAACGQLCEFLVYDCAASECDGLVMGFEPGEWGPCFWSQCAPIYDTCFATLCEEEGEPGPVDCAAANACAENGSECYNSCYDDDGNIIGSCYNDCADAELACFDEVFEDVAEQGGYCAYDASWWANTYCEHLCGTFDYLCMAEHCDGLSYYDDSAGNCWFEHCSDAWDACFDEAANGCQSVGGGADCASLELCRNQYWWCASPCTAGDTLDGACLTACLDAEEACYEGVAGEDWYPEVALCLGEESTCNHSCSQLSRRCWVDFCDGLEGDPLFECYNDHCFEVYAGCYETQCVGL